MTYGKSACFHIEAKFEPLYHSLQATFRFLPNSSTTCGSGSSHEVPTSIKDHKWLTEFYTIDGYRAFRRLLRPEAHASIRYDTASDCHNRASVPFWLMRGFNLLSHVTGHDL